MKRVGKPVFFIVLAVIAFIGYTSLFGISSQYGDRRTVYLKGGQDIRWGIDIRGGVDVTFSPPEDIKLSAAEMKKAMGSAEEIIKQRLVAQNITDSEVYTDYNKKRIIVRFPWKEGEEDFDPEKAIEELGDTAMLTFREGYEQDPVTGAPTGTTKEKVVLVGSDIKEAKAQYDSSESTYVVALELNSEGAKKFAEATSRLKGDYISIWMDDSMVSAPKVNETISDGKAVISGGNGGFTQEDAESLARKINSGSLPFKLETSNFNTISPILGESAKDAMVLAGVIAMILVCAFMIIVYRLPGVIASIALVGQIAGSIACVSGYFPSFPSFTLTLPGIAGIILSVGMGVDANVITAERIKEELLSGKTLDGSINLGYDRGFSAVFDGNITMVITAVVLMGAFGPPSSIFAKLLTPLFFMFGQSTAGAIYSFGYTLLAGVIFNFVMGVTASRLMLQSISRFKFLRKPWLYGGVK